MQSFVRIKILAGAAKQRGSEPLSGFRFFIMHAALIQQ